MPSTADRLEQAREAEHELDLRADRQLAVRRDERAARRQVLGVVADQIVGAFVLDEQRDRLAVALALLVVSAIDVAINRSSPLRERNRSNAGFAGTLTVNVVPRPTVLCTDRSPPWSLTICWVSARPRPLPPSFVEKNGSNRRGSTSAGDADAVVLDVDHDAIADDARAQRDGAAALAGERFARVADEVDQALADLRGVDERDRIAVARARRRA